MKLHLYLQALLPMDELCLLENEFEKKQGKSAVTKILNLPLVLTRSSLTLPYLDHSDCGVLTISITYSQQDQMELQGLIGKGK